MKIAAVAVINFFDNEIEQRILVVPNQYTWKEALIESDLTSGLDKGWFTDLSDDYDEARNQFFNCDAMFSVTFFDPNERKL